MKVKVYNKLNKKLVYIERENKTLRFFRNRNSARKAVGPDVTRSEVWNCSRVMDLMFKTRKLINKAGL